MATSSQPPPSTTFTITSPISPSPSSGTVASQARTILAPRLSISVFRSPIALALGLMTVLTKLTRRPRSLMSKLTALSSIASCKHETQFGKLILR